MTNERFRTELGVEITVEEVAAGEWRLVLERGAERRIGKTVYATKAEALDALRRNSVRR